MRYVSLFFDLCPVTGLSCGYLPSFCRMGVARRMLVTFLLLLVSNASRATGYYTFDGIRYFVDTYNGFATVAGPLNKSLKTYTVLSTVAVDGVEYRVTSLERNSFSDCGNLQNMVIPSSVNSLEAYSFANCASLQSIVIPSSVVNLEDFCFSGCSSLQGIDIPSSVTSLGKSCFKGCSSLQSFCVPDSADYLESYCFDGCKNLRSITISASVKRIGTDCFGGCENLYNVTCLSLTPPSVDDRKSHYNYFLPRRCQILVPNEAVDVYKSESPWRNYSIYPIKETGILSVNVKGASAVVRDGMLVVSGLDDGEQVGFFCTDGKQIGNQRASRGVATMPLSSLCVAEEVVIVKTKNFTFKVKAK